MKELSNKELLTIAGGASLSASFFNALSRTVETVLEVGRSLGSAIRRLFNGSYCSV